MKNGKKSAAELSAARRKAAQARWAGHRNAGPLRTVRTYADDVLALRVWAASHNVSTAEAAATAFRALVARG